MERGLCSSIRQKEAKYLYGILFGFGALGGFLGSLIPGFWATTFGSESLLICSLPLYALLIFAYHYLLRYSGSEKQKVEAQRTQNFASLGQGVNLIKSSSLLKCILTLCVFMQVVATLADFQFQTFLAEAFPQKDLRTECMGQIVSLGNILTMILQFVGTFAFIRFLGLQGAHLVVPIVLSLGISLFLWIPSFYVLSSFFVVLKALEFSLFTVIKEMLYIPMRLEEKFQAKSIIDVFMGRFAKIFASICILAVQFFYPQYALDIVGIVLLGILLSWGYLVFKMKPHYEKSDPKSWIGQEKIL
jgi:ATP/ADP translocase